MMDTLKAKTIKIHKKIKQNHYHKLVKNQNKDMTLPLMALLALSSIVAFVLPRKRKN